MKIYLVGGAVRDSLLKIPFEEKDWVVVGYSPEELSEQGYMPVGSQFPVFLHPTTKEEYALARTERKSGKGHKGFIFHTDPSVTLEEDLIRRDITINAIAQDSDGNLIDPYEGRKDINDRKIRKVSDAFKEDPLRVYRTCRFEAKLHHLGFTIEEKTLSSMKEIVLSGELETLPKERIWMETIKALNCKSPDKYFKTLRSCGALKTLIKEDSLNIESLAVIKNKTINPEMRWAALLSDTKQIKDVNSEFNAPKTFMQLSEVLRHLTLFMSKVDFSPEIILSLLQTTDAFRRPERFMTAIDAFRLIKDSKETINWSNLLSNLSSVRPSTNIKKGNEIAQDLKEKRLEAITKFIQ